MLPLLRIKNLSANFAAEGSKSTVLKNISFQLNKGEITGLVGESGSGKSVSALSILRLIPSPPVEYTDGSILFSEDGIQQTDLLKATSQQLQKIRGNKIAMIFQEPMTSLNPVISCGQQVAEAIRVHKKLPASEAKERAEMWLEKVKLPDPSAIYDRYPHQLSGGQKQRVMIAMAMCCKPSLLICDEPTTALDVSVQKTILDLIKELQQEQDMGVLFISHDLNVIAEIADNAIVMYKGEIAEQNSVHELFHQPKHPYTQALLACRPASHKKGERLRTVNEFLNPVSNIIIKEQSPIEHKTVYETPFIKAKNIIVEFPARKNILGKPTQYVRAVNDVSFEIFKGETVGLVGESGCGKTTLGRTLLQLIKPTGGSIQYEGAELVLSDKEQLKAFRKNTQIIFQDPYSSLNPRITIGSAIAEAMQVHGIGSNDAERREKVIFLLNKVNLDGSHFSRYPHEFSGGQRQRIVIARALALNPSFVVCDESVSALDISVQAQVLNLLNDLKKEFGFTILFISHDLSVIHYISDRIVVMQKGKIVESGDAEEIYLRPQHEYTKRLISFIPKGVASA